MLHGLLGLDGLAQDSCNVFLAELFFEPLLVITMNAEAFEEQIQNKHELKQET